MKLTFLGTGTSHGVPVIGCDCEVCRSHDPRDHRLRSSALVETSSTRLLIDCGPDDRQQLLKIPFRKIDGVLITHAHYDHVGGLDDLRAFCQFGDIDLYANDVAAKSIRHNFPYYFEEKLYPGVPRFHLHEVPAHVPFRIGDQEIVPVSIMHDKLPIFGYRIGRLAYLTDVKTIPSAEYDYLKGIDTLVISSLRWEVPHHSHLLVADAIAIARRIGARRTYLMHLTHKIGLYDEASARLPEDVRLAYDGLTIEI